MKFHRRSLPALAVIAFAATWGCMGLMQLISRLLGVRKTAK